MTKRNILKHTPRHSRSQALIDYAYSVAKTAHGNQVRKYTNTPYITHPLAVSHIVASVTDDCNMICAALLHDTIEDTELTFKDICNNGLGKDIANLVLELTDVAKPEDGNRAIRMKINREHTAKACPDAKTIKLADLIHNSVSICAYDKDFAQVYMKEKTLLLKVLTEGDQDLYNKALNMVAKFNNIGTLHD